MVSSDTFRLGCREDTDRVLVAPEGELDYFTADSFNAALTRIEEAAPPLLVLDLRRLRLVDSTGLRSLLDAARRAKEEHRRVAMVRGPEAVQSVFRICGIDQFFEQVDDPSDLRDAF